MSRSSKKMNKFFEAVSGGPGVQQATGYGKNYHTAKPEPITWENIAELEHFVTAMPNGTFLAGVSLPNSDHSSPTYSFNSEEDAMAWIRNTVESYKIKKANQVS